MAGILPVLWAVCLWYWGFPAGVADFFQLHTVYTGSDNHLACWMGAWGFFCGGKVAGLWSWPRTSVSCWVKKWVEQYVPFPMCLYGLRSGCFQGRFEIWWIVLKYIDGTGLFKEKFFKMYFPWTEASTRFKVSSEHVSHLCGSQEGDLGLKSLVVYHLQNTGTLEVILIQKLPVFCYWNQVASVDCVLLEHVPATLDWTVIFKDQPR